MDLRHHPYNLRPNVSHQTEAMTVSSIAPAGLLRPPCLLMLLPEGWGRPWIPKGDVKRSRGRHLGLPGPNPRAWTPLRK